MQREYPMISREATTATTGSARTTARDQERLAAESSSPDSPFGR